DDAVAGQRGKRSERDREENSQRDWFHPRKIARGFRSATTLLGVVARALTRDLSKIAAETAASTTSQTENLELGGTSFNARLARTSSWTCRSMSLRKRSAFQPLNYALGFCGS